MSTKVKTQQILKHLKQELYNKGFDIYHEFCVQRYNDLIVKNNDKLMELPTYNLDKTFGLLIGNTKYLWNIFINELKHNKNKYISNDNLLDYYTHNNIDNICNRILSNKNDDYYMDNNNESMNELNNLINDLDNNINYTIRYYWELNKHKLISFGQLCHISNLAYLDKNSYLCIHNKYGPWFALRCVIVLNIPFNDQINNDIILNPVSNDENIKVTKQMNIIQHDLFDKNKNNDIPSWKYWLNLRECYTIGNEYKYSDDQIKYHYTKDMNALHKLCNWK